MNKKAAAFQAYLDERKISVFTRHEIEGALNPVVFRSQLDVQQGNLLTVLVLLDDSVYTVVRTVVAPGAVTDANRAAVLALANGYNKLYKNFKYYVDDAQNLVLDVCLVTVGDTVDGDLVYSVFDLLLRHLNESYKEVMQTVWGATQPAIAEGKEG